MALYFTLSEWGFHYKKTHYRLCEKSHEAIEIAIGPFWLEWDEWV